MCRMTPSLNHNNKLAAVLNVVAYAPKILDKHFGSFKGHLDSTYLGLSQVDVVVWFVVAVSS